MSRRKNSGFCPLSPKLNRDKQNQEELGAWGLRNCKEDLMGLNLICLFRL